jgi:hypothetical protein
VLGDAKRVPPRKSIVQQAIGCSKIAQGGTIQKNGFSGMAFESVPTETKKPYGKSMAKKDFRPRARNVPQ